MLSIPKDVKLAFEKNHLWRMSKLKPYSKPVDAPSAALLTVCKYAEVQKVKTVIDPLGLEA